MQRFIKLLSETSNRRTRANQARPFAYMPVLMIVLLGVMTACAPQAPLPTQAALPPGAPQNPIVNPPLPTALPQEAQPAAPTSQPAEASQPEAPAQAVNETVSEPAAPAHTVKSQPAFSNAAPTVRVFGIPEITVSEPAVPNVIVIQTSGSNLAAVQAQVEILGGTITRDEALGTLGAVVVTLPENANPSEIAKLADTGHAEPDYYAVALANDPLVEQQWGRTLLNLETPASAATGFTVKVAVIDSGACASHPDLAGQYLAGWDYIGSDSDPSDEFGHGCQVSGIIAAIEDNDIGIAGISPQIRILPYRVLDGRGIGRYSDVAAAIVRAVQDGAQVINLSLGGPNSSNLLSEAVEYARQAGVVVVAAAGNSGQEQVYYPAAIEGVISVGAIGENHMRSTFSNYGKIDLWAAGENVLTTTLDGTYGRVSGTSFAAPHVSGLAALEIAAGRHLIADGRIAAYGGAGSDIVAAPIPEPTEPQKSQAGYFMPAMKNPAALACENLGYRFVVTADADGNETSACLMPDMTQCEQWAFYAGTCGQAFNFCAQQGLQTVSLSDGQDPFFPVYAACVDASGQTIGSVSDLTNLQAQAAGCMEGGCQAFPDPAESQGRQVDPASDSVSGLAVPTSWDWRSYNDANWVTPIKNQGGCGSCGVFAAVGIIEAALAIAEGNPGWKPDLSEQYMISTCFRSPNTICSSGSHSDWTLAVAKNDGLCDEACMPYVARSTDCGTKCSDWADRRTKIADYGFVWGPGISATYIKQLIVNRGPVATYMRISNGSYSNGYLTCTQDTPLDHAVILVGYNDAGGYWIMRNSWGTSWGDGGYAKVRYGDCGIDSTYIAFASTMSAVPSALNVVRNGTFDNDTIEWATSGEVEWVVENGVLHFKRANPSPNGFSIYQTLNYRFPQNTPVEVLVDLGNTSNVAKTVDITLRNMNTWEGARTCRVTIPPQSPLRTYALELITGEWVNARFDIGLLQADGLPNVMMDNVRVANKAGASDFKCRYPQAEANTELLHNGAFDLGIQGWETPASGWNVTNGEIKLTGVSAESRVLSQNTARRLPVNSPVELTFTIKNPSPNLRNIKVTLIDDSNPNWSALNLVTCTFVIPSNQSSFTSYVIRGKLPTETANLRVHIEVPGDTASPDILFSDFELYYRPTLSLTARECISPSTNPPTSAPVLTLPVSPTSNNTPTITIGSVLQAETYEFQIGTTALFPAPLIYVANLTSDQLTHTVGVPLSDGTVYIRARAVKNSNPPDTAYGPWSTAKSLVIDATAPAVPTLLILPAADAVINTTYTPLFSWQKVVGAISYEIDLGQTEPGPSDQTPISVPVRVVPSAVGTTVSWAANRGLSADVPYYWRVRSRDALGNVSLWSDARSFIISSPAGVAPRLNPQPNTPTITWSPMPSALGYHVQVASDKLFTKVVYDNALIVDTSSITVPTLESGAYFYRVRTKITAGWGAWSAVTPLVVNP